MGAIKFLDKVQESLKLEKEISQKIPANLRFEMENAGGSIKVDYDAQTFSVVGCNEEQTQKILETLKK